MTDNEQITEICEAIEDVVFQATTQYLDAVYTDAPTEVISEALRTAMPKVVTAMIAALAQTELDRDTFLDEFLQRVAGACTRLKSQPIPCETMQ